MEINEILSIRYDFDKREKNTCVNGSRMNAMFNIPYSFRLSVKFSIHMMNSMRTKIGFRVQMYQLLQVNCYTGICTHYFTK